MPGWPADDHTVVGYAADLASGLGLEQAMFTARGATLVRAKLILLGHRDGLIWMRRLPFAR
jgi:hypothetical protein